jgi:hypothetical protein
MEHSREILGQRIILFTLSGSVEMGLVGYYGSPGEQLRSQYDTLADGRAVCVAFKRTRLMPPRRWGRQVQVLPCFAHIFLSRGLDESPKCRRRDFCGAMYSTHKHPMSDFVRDMAKLCRISLFLLLLRTRRS